MLRLSVDIADCEAISLGKKYDSDEELLDIVHGFQFDAACQRAEKEAKVAADHIFESLAQTCPSLVALSFDLNDAYGSAVYNVDFLRVRQIDIFGRTTYAARAVEIDTIKFYEPCSDILDFATDVHLLED